MLALVPLLSACGGGSTGSAGPAATAPSRSGASRDEVSTTTRPLPDTDAARGSTPSRRRDRDLPLALPTPKPGRILGIDDPCKGTKRERVRRHNGIGTCADDVADRVVERDEPLRLSGMVFRLDGPEPRSSIPGAAADGGALVPADPGTRFAVARLTISNRRPTSVSFSRQNVTLGFRGVYGRNLIWALAGPRGAIGADRDEIRVGPGATRTVVAVWQRQRSGPQASDVGARLGVDIPDPPGTPKHGPGKTKLVTIRSGVFRLDP
jgi:hypothetical protein